MIRTLLYGGGALTVFGVTYSRASSEQSLLNGIAYMEARAEAQRLRDVRVLEIEHELLQGRSRSPLFTDVMMTRSGMETEMERFPEVLVELAYDEPEAREERRESMGRSWVKHQRSWEPLGQYHVRPRHLQEGKLIKKVRKRRSAHRLALMKEWYGDFDHTKEPTLPWPV